MHRLTSVLAVTLAGATLLAAPRAASAEPISIGPIVGVDLGAGSSFLGDAELGVHVEPHLAVLARGGVFLVNERNSGTELGGAVRLTARTGLGLTFVEPQLSYLTYDAEADCIGYPPKCTGGRAHGLSGGAVLGVALAHGDDYRLDLRLGATVLHWRDAATSAPNNELAIRIGLGVSFF